MLVVYTKLTCGVQNLPTLNGSQDREIWCLYRGLVLFLGADSNFDGGFALNAIVAIECLKAVFHL